MWKDYFGPQCRVYGIDIEPECRVYENDGVQVFIGDQASRHFWREFKRVVPHVDILIDDGGHQFIQQAVTLEEMLPHIRPGGVYMCEDVHERDNEFMAYVSGLADGLNAFEVRPGGEVTCKMSAFQRSISSMHFYPFLIVIEKPTNPTDYLMAPKHGTEWQPFLG
jgi:hypothetical protein